jgi:hypothetical protein
LTVAAVVRVADLAAEAEAADAGDLRDRAFSAVFSVSLSLVTEVPLSAVPFCAGAFATGDRSASGTAFATAGDFRVIDFAPAGPAVFRAGGVVTGVFGVAARGAELVAARVRGAAFVLVAGLVTLGVRAARGVDGAPASSSRAGAGGTEPGSAFAADCAGMAVSVTFRTAPVRSAMASPI